jgi:Mg2+ and Co2+ transporter CorA
MPPTFKHKEDRPMREFEIIETHIKKQRHNGRPLHNRRYRLTAKDRDLIKKQLKIFPLEDLLDAITQTHRTPWNLGDNPNGKKHLRLGLCIDDEHIQRRLEEFEEYEQRLQRAADRAAREAETAAEDIPASTITDTRAAYREARRANDA